MPLRGLCVLAVALCGTALAAGPLGLPDAPAATDETRLTITWYGVATLLFDDGETQVLIDGFFSRPSRDAPFIFPNVEQIERQTTTWASMTSPPSPPFIPTSTTRWTWASSPG